ncbi:MAG TPA: PIN domain-containing protein [Parafilimonas sp.]|nr:PIN domain-containing protein [Parafilimonas sp.]
MKYVVIDTCSWINLISENEFNPHITLLVFWIEQNNLQLLMPESIIHEWNEGKDTKKNSIMDSWNAKKRHSQQVAKKSYKDHTLDFPFDLSFVEQQIDTIDKLILNCSVQIKTSGRVKALAADKSIKPYKAPFHNKLDSMKDAYIYFSALEFCGEHSISQLLFISENTKDFGKPISQGKGSKNEIHPELLTDFPSIKVDYFGEIGWAITELKRELPLLPVQAITEEKTTSNNYYSIPENNLPLIEYLHRLFEKIYDELNFIPINIITKIPPFKTNQSGYAHYNIFTLSTNNKTFLDFFDALMNNEKAAPDYSKTELFHGVKNYVQKTEMVIRVLNRNLIFNLRDEKSRRQLNIHLQKNVSCDCVKCSFYKFNFHKTFTHLNDAPDDFNEKLKLAYINYQAGNYLMAKNIYLEVSRDAKQQKKDIIHFICQFNLSKLAVFIRNHYWGENNQKELVEELAKIDIQMLSQTLNLKSSNTLYQWIESREFFTNISDNINELVSKILDHYYSQLNGGWQSNEYIKELINEFAELDSFLNLNFIIYDRFVEFDRFFARVLEGLLASHSITNKQGSRFSFFDDYWIKKIICYAKKDDILKYVKRYGLKELIYSESTDDVSFLELSRNLMSNAEETKIAFETYCEKNNNSFIDKYNQYFENIFTMASLLMLSEKIVNELTILLIHFSMSEEMIFWNKYDAVKLFIKEKGSLIKNDLLKEFLLSIYRKTKLHEHGLAEAVLEQIAVNGEFSLHEKDFNSLIENFFSKCAKCGRIHKKEELLALYKAVNIKYRSRITDKTEKSLAEKFDLEMFYLATISDVIPFSNALFNIYLKKCEPEFEKKSFPAFLSSKGNYHSMLLDMLLNLCFKFNIDLNEGEFNKLKNVNNYYCWLADMDNFNYDLFDPEWVMDYQTIYYLKVMSKSKQLINALVNFLKIKQHKGVEKVLLKITYYVEH